MSVEHFYNLYVSISPPQKPMSGWIWLNPVLSQVYMYIIDEWQPFAGDTPISDYINDKLYWMSTITQPTTPTGANNVLGKIWIKSDTGQAYIKLNDWIQIAGG